jgi:TetR/AcrR family transcriptional regulator, tetracycline repressor protein
VSSSSPPVSDRSGRPPRPTLTEEQIVDAALQVVRAEGVDGLTMRRLSRELGVSPMAAYYHVAGKQELLDLVAARALADISAPTQRQLAWHVRLRILIDRIDTELRHHRGVEEVLLERMHTTQRHVMRALMDLFAEAGFDDAGIVMAYATVHTYLFGRYRVSLEGPPDQASGDGGRSDDPDIVARLLPTVSALRGRDYYEFGVETVIEGLRAQLRRQRRIHGRSGHG